MRDLLEKIIINYFVMGLGCALSISFFIYVLLNKKLDMKKYALYLFSCTLMLGTNVQFSSYYGMKTKGILTIVILILLIKIFYNLKYWQSILTIAIFTIILGLSDTVKIYIQNIFNIKFSDLSTSYLLAGIATLINYVITCTVFLLLSTYKLVLKFPKEMRKKAYIINLSYTIIVVLIIQNNINFYVKFNNMLDLKDAFFNMILILSFFIISLITTNTFFSLENKKQELEYQLFYNKTLETTINELKRFKHNYANMISVIGGYIKLKDIKGMEKYYNEVYKELNDFNTQDILFNNIKNVGVLGIITTKLDLAKKNDIDARIVVFGQVNEVAIKISLLCEMLGIILDNAVEAASQNNKKYIEIQIKDVNNYVTFTIINPAKEEVAISEIFKNGYSTKGEGRGLGLSVLKKIADSNKDVMLNTTIRNCEFIQELTVKQNNTSVAI